MRKHGSIGKLFVIIFLFFLILPVTIASFVFMTSVYDTNKKKIEADIEILAHSIAGKVDTSLKAPAAFLMTVVDLLDEGSGCGEVQNLLDNGVGNFPVFDALYTLDKDKKVEQVAFSLLGKYDPSDFIGIKLHSVKSFSKKSLYWSIPFQALVTSHHTVRVTVEHDEGYVVGDINLQFLADDLLKQKYMETGVIHILDEGGNVVSCSDNKQGYLNLNIFNHPVFQQGLNGNHVLMDYEWDDREKIGATYRLSSNGWYLLLEQDKQEAFRFFHEITKVGMASGFFLVFFIVVVLYFIRVKLIKPIKTITEYSEQISRGEYLKLDTDINVFRELQTLYDSFENMSVTIGSRENELRRKEEYIRSIFDSTTNTGIIVLSADRDPVVTDANMGAQLILGYKMSDLMRFHPAGLVRDGGDDINRLQREAVSRKSMTTGRFEMLKKSGVPFPVLCTVHPLMPDGDEIESLIMVFIDITEITRVQSALEGEKERLDVTLKSIGEGVVATDRNGRITLMNSSAENILAQKGRFILGHNVSDILHIYDFETGENIIDELKVVEKGTKKTLRANIVSKHAGIITVTLTASGMLSSKGEIVGFVYVFRDITDRIKMDQELLNRKVQLEEINKNLELRITEEAEKRRRNEQLLFEQAKFAAMGQMISAIAHQWRQPLNALALYTQDIEDAYEAGEVDKDFLSRFVESSMKLINHMSGTIDDFRHFFHASKVKEDVDMVQVVADSMSLISTQLRNQNINYEIIISNEDEEKVFVNSMPAADKSYGKTVLISSSEMKQVLLNILQNARDAITEQRTSSLKKAGNIYISIAYDVGKIVTTISNDGGRIPEDILPNIFDPYYTTKPEGEGTGIGLYMSKVMIEDHMDGLLIASNTENGAKFTITLYYDE